MLTVIFSAQNYSRIRRYCEKPYPCSGNWAVFERNPEAVYRAMSRAVLSGSAHAFKEIADRAYGKVTNVFEVTGNDGLHALTRDELDTRIQALITKLGFAGGKNES